MTKSEKEAVWGEADQLIDQFIGLDFFKFSKFAVTCSPGVPVQDAIDHLLKWIRRRAVRRSEYVWSTETGTRIRRDGLPWSWVEEYIMKAAFTRKDSETPKGVVVTIEYIASLLQRSEEEVKVKKNTKLGIVGFDL